MDQNDFSSFVVALCCEMIFVSADSARFTSVSNYGAPLFEKLTNHGGEPIEEDPWIRERVCEDINSSRLFQLMGFIPIDAQKIYDNRNQEKYARLYRLVFSWAYYKYVNSYHTRNLTTVSNEDITDINVFVCPFEDVINNSLQFYDVTKEYHVGATDEPYKPGRFLIGKLMRIRNAVVHVLLAEEPAIAYDSSDQEFNIELYYLSLREYVKPAENNGIDPLCKEIGGGREQNQLVRFCAAVLKSSYFEDKLGYPKLPTVDEKQCYTKYVTFRTMEGLEKANGRSFYEQMMLCRSIHLDSLENIHLYVSRGYMSNQVFVYYENLIDGNIYLKNLSTNIAIRDELNSFDFPEV